MNTFAHRVLAYAAALLTVACAQSHAPAAVAARYDSGLDWKAESAVRGDFTCRGQDEHAVLGIGGGQIVVAIFAEGLDQPPTLLRFPATMRDPATSTLTVESLDIDLDRLSSEIGVRPDGLQPSKTCKGLNLSDGKVDSAHIYWNHAIRRFAAWSL